MFEIKCIILAVRIYIKMEIILLKPSNSICRTILLLCYAVCSFSYSNLVFSSEVLVIHSDYQGDEWTRDIQSGIEHKFKDEGLTLYVSYLDSYQELSDSALAKYADFYAQKYETRNFEAVIISGDNALRLVQRYGDRLFINRPIIFTGIKEYKAPVAGSTLKMSGVMESDNILANISLSLSLFPNTTEVYIITGNSLDSKLTSEKIQKLTDQVGKKLVVLNDETEVSLKQKVSQLSNNAILIFSDFSRDRNGMFVPRSAILQSVINVARAPLFVVNKHDLKEGVLGGGGRNGFIQGKTAAIKVLDLLQGVPIDALPIDMHSSDKYQFQHDQLLRWNIDKSDLPVGSLIINEPINQYQKDFSLVVLLFISLVFITLIGFLLRKYYVLNQTQALLKERNDRVEHLVNSSYDFTFVLDTVGEIRQVNKTALNFVGMVETEVKGTMLWDTPWWQYDPSCQKRLKSAMGQARIGNATRFECKLIDKDQQRHTFDISIKPVASRLKKNNMNPISSIMVEARDISNIKAVEEDIHKANKRSNLLLDESPSMLLMLNAQGLILSCNKFGCNLVGYEDGELIGRNLVTLYHQTVELAELKEYLAKCCNNDDMQLTREISYSTKSNVEVWINERVRKIEGHDQYFLVCENITERYELSKELSYRASHDYLTGLKNRLFFETHLEKNLKDLTGQSIAYSLMYLDMDKFKIINDTCGHQAGDEVLRQIAIILTESVAEDSVVARLGGDEFAIIMPMTDITEAKIIAKKIIDSIGKHNFFWEEHHFTLGISIGLAELADSGRGGVHALSCVDSACYTAKQSGRNRIHVYEEDKQEELRREEIVWVNKVQDALRDESRFCLYAQLIKPINGDEDYLHYEILTRMIDENGLLAPPDKFIPVAESYNLADKIDMMIITKTLSWLRNHPEHVLKLNMCSINLSGQSLGDPKFIKDLVDLLTDCSLPLEKLCFEITETVAIGNFSHASKLISSLKKLGCQLALDDFGTGLSSFAYLKRLNVDYLKIDGVFVKDMATNKQDFGIVKSIHELSHIFGKKTIAEYVENEDIIEKLKEIGVDFAQGYHLGRPVPLDMMALLSDSMYEDDN